MLSQALCADPTPSAEHFLLRIRKKNHVVHDVQAKRQLALGLLELNQNMPRHATDFGHFPNRGGVGDHLVGILNLGGVAIFLEEAQRLPMKATHSNTLGYVKRNLCGKHLSHHVLHQRNNSQDKTSKNLSNKKRPQCYSKEGTDFALTVTTFTKHLSKSNINVRKSEDSEQMWWFTLHSPTRLAEIQYVSLEACGLLLFEQVALP